MELVREADSWELRDTYQTLGLSLLFTDEESKARVGKEVFLEPQVSLL